MAFEVGDAGVRAAGHHTWHCMPRSPIAAAAWVPNGRRLNQPVCSETGDRKKACDRPSLLCAIPQRRQARLCIRVRTGNPDDLSFAVWIFDTIGGQWYSRD